jgi:glycosyltransferase involved in cell wall biosynthesis
MPPADPSSKRRGLRVLIVVQNMSFTYDTRMKNIARTLAHAACRVWVIAPRYPGDPYRRRAGGVTALFFPLPSLPGGFIGHLLEYAVSFFWITLATLAAFIVMRFDVIHICNPPDIFFPLGRLYRLLGRKFVFDLHDLCPELWDARYRGSRAVQKILLSLERSTANTANLVLTTSETAMQRVRDRTGIAASHVMLVRNGPDLDTFPQPTPASCGDGVEIGYVGDMNPQDGIDNLLNAAHYLRHTLGRTDLRYVLIGDGDALDVLKEAAHTLGIADIVVFTGRMRHKDAMDRLSKCAFCVQPDVKNGFNDACVMVKSLEYMALGKSIAAFDLNETRRICGEAALYAMENDPRCLAQQMDRLADDPALRNRLGALGRRRIEEGLAWSFCEQQLIDAYGRLEQA